MQYSTVAYDLVVVGGGIGGVVTAVTAARQGLSVALVDDKAGLGGNACSDIGVSIDGASFFGFFANMREGGPVEEMKENLAAVDLFARRTLTSPVLLFWCEEAGVRVYCDLHIHEVETEGRRVKAVKGSQAGTERNLRFTAAQFVDASGDAAVAAAAGCAVMTGREGKAAFGEILAPDEPDTGIMGASLLFRASRKTVPSTFVRPEWAYEYRSAEDLPFRLDPAGRPVEMGFWWIEYAGDHDDPIGEYEEVRKELLKCVFGVWSYYKNHPSRQMEYYGLDHVTVSPAKRESRRIVGDYVLTERDVVARTPFPDAIAYAGWNIDIHVPGGFKSPLKPNIHAFFPWVCTLPLRILYARDMENLWMVGRNVSVSHVALGATRLQATIGLLGHAVGVAAAVAHREHKSPRRTAADHIAEIQQTLLKDGSFIPGVRNTDPLDRALTARVTATSDLPLRLDPGSESLEVGPGRALAFPVTGGRLDRLVLPLCNGGEASVAARLFLSACAHPNACSHRRPLAETGITLAPGWQDVAWEVGLPDLPPGLYAVGVMTDGQVAWRRAAQEPFGCYTFLYQPGRFLTPTRDTADNLYAARKPIMMTEDGSPVEWCRQYRHRWHALGHAVDRACVPLPAALVTPAQRPYRPGNVTSGVSHTDVLPDLWISDPDRGLPQALELRWDAPRALSEVRLVFDTDLDMPHPAVEPVDYLAKEYQIAVSTPSGWKTLVAEEDNRRRFRVHALQPCETDGVRITVSAAHAGGRSARIFEVRCY